MVVHMEHTMIFGNLKNDFVNTLKHMGGNTFEHLQCRHSTRQKLVLGKLGFLKWLTLLTSINREFW